MKYDLIINIFYNTLHQIKRGVVPPKSNQERNRSRHLEFSLMESVFSKRYERNLYQT